MANVNGIYAASFEEIGDRLGITREEARTAERQALTKLRRIVPRPMLLAVLRRREFAVVSRPKERQA